MDPFDLASVFSLRRLLGEVTDRDVPVMRTVAPVERARSVALLPGSFNPPTVAHVHLAERALLDGIERVVLTYARTTVGKSQSGLIPEDRLLLMRAASVQGTGVAAVSHGLYADQAEAAGALFPGASIYFLVGSDKVIQIFQHHWYPDRDEALERLFSRAVLIAAPRSDQGEQLTSVLRASENKRWADRVDIVRLHPAIGELSSTRVRGLLRAGAEPAGLVPSAAAPLLSSMGAFAPPMLAGSEEIDAYTLRARLIDVLWEMYGPATPAVDLRALCAIAVSQSEHGKRFRSMLGDDSFTQHDLLRAQEARA